MNMAFGSGRLVSENEQPTLKGRNVCEATALPENAVNGEKTRIGRVGQWS